MKELGIKEYRELTPIEGKFRMEETYIGSMISDRNSKIPLKHGLIVSAWRCSMRRLFVLIIVRVKKKCPAIRWPGICRYTAERQCLKFPQLLDDFLPANT